ncbi:2,5-dioxovalerate dehydrogenase [Sorangium cellulosum]|uniref:2,5-dioxovalerate dehydrogenase n=2 Tax=Sorangium cellulosum TaxID=56 RepID=A0A150PW15_SORCE|nr:aldehyde dehydrogenase (NADP(+)) [Sorangium cellulosum]AGP41397.1 2,5-dioxovalerate dehydrogenase [Sorangium cellulosum So0157-2]KYF59935.1 2,5-dioxovalerate dehydrogenase [Sorangium cellulosum]
MEFFALNAATGEKLGAYRDATAAEIDAAARAAAEAAQAFADLAPELRARFLETAADEIVALGDALIQTAHRETGLPVARLEGERGRTTGQLRLFAAVVREGSWVDARIDPALPDRKPLPRPDLRRMLRPIGPVAIFGASNFPLAFSVAGGDTASALAAGNPVVVKAHPAHPGTSDLVASALRSAVQKAGLPAGVFGMVHGASPEVSLLLVRHEAIQAVGFTGSTRAGRALCDAAAARPRPIPVFAEMSSINPLVVLPGALRERRDAIAEGLASSCTLGVGQFCTKPGLVLGLASPEWDAFARSVADRARAVAPGVMLHAGIQASFDRSVRELNGVEWLTDAGARVARVSAADFARQPHLAHEIFGPYALLVTASSRAELLELLGALEGQLTATLHGTAEDLAAAQDLVDVLGRVAGRLVFNGYPTGVEVSHAMHHGGPYPASSDVRFTSVGTAAIFRFARPVCYQSCPPALLPPALRDENPLGITRLVDGQATRDPVAPRA